MPSILSITSTFAFVAAVMARNQGGVGRFPCSSISNGVQTIDPTQCSVENMTQNQACPAGDNTGFVDGTPSGAPGFKFYGAGEDFDLLSRRTKVAHHIYVLRSPRRRHPMCTGFPFPKLVLWIQNISSSLAQFQLTGPSILRLGAHLTTNATTDLAPKGSASVCNNGNQAGADGNCAAAAAPGPSARSRSRRAAHEDNTLVARGSRCPASQSACAVTGSLASFECVDTSVRSLFTSFTVPLAHRFTVLQSNLEQCGACSSSGGADCTALPGVDAVGCVAGVCEIWACAEGFAWDVSAASCSAALIV
ncbi:hypothetical protein P7C70_g1542, partial [Phenoliferia sp. Uapishka_3]